MAGKKKNFKKKITRIGIRVLSILMGLGFLFFAAVYLGLFGHLPSAEELSKLQHNQSSEILDVNGKPIGHLYRFYHASIKYEQLPEHLVHALVSTEDVRFYDHHGIDYRSLLRVFFKTILLQDQSSGGGSTITQQLAKNLFPRANGFLSLPGAKVKEMIIATRLEKVYSKEEILALYLNSVTFSDNTFGVASAARTFFNKPVSDLTIEESATLIGMLKATYTYNPRVYPERSLGRRNVVINQMVNYDFLTEEQAKLLVGKPLVLNYKPFDTHEGSAPYFIEEVRKALVKWVKENPKEDGSLYDIYGEGLKIHTTLDVRMQTAAEEAMQAHMAALQKAFENNWGSRAPWTTNKAILETALTRNREYQRLKKSGLNRSQIIDSLSIKRKMRWFSWEKGEEEVTASVVDSLLHHLKQLQSGFLVITPQTGAVKVWIGGIDHHYFQYDHISQGKRQVGSTFKPIVYTAALEKGVEPCDYFPARAVTYSNMEDWTPTNSENVDFLHKNYSMKAALKKSLNTVSVKILEETGINNVLDLAKQLQIKSQLPHVPSLALGAGEVSILELAGAYAGFANDRKPVAPYFISRITDRSGKVLATFEPETFSAAFSENSQTLMIEMMKSVVNEGTASRLRWKYGIKNDIAGKTGTTQANKDGWFVGVTPKLVAVSWVGADDGRISFKDTNIGQGANSALPIFAIFMQKINADKSLSTFTNARFPEPSKSVLRQLSCDDEKEDGFLKKLFTNEEKAKTKEFGETKKKGFFDKVKKAFKKD